MIVEQRIRDYLHSLEPDQGDLLEEISRKAIRDEVPIIKKETGALLKTMVAAKRPSGSRNCRRLFCFIDGRRYAGRMYHNHH